MTSLLRGFWKTAGILALSILGGASGYATNFTGTNIAIPTGLTQGQTFQLVFVTTGTTAATSTDIATYNAFVTAEANQSDSLFSNLGLTWTAIVSTASVNVLSNIVNTSPSMPGFQGIFNEGGSANLIADGTENTGNGLFGTESYSIQWTDRTGGVQVVGGNTPVWTGTNADGTTSASPLGSANPTYGYARANVNQQYSVGTSPQATAYNIYAISNLLTLGPGNTLQVVTPEPGSAGLAIAGLAACWLAVKRRGRQLNAGARK